MGYLPQLDSTYDSSYRYLCHHSRMILLSWYSYLTTPFLEAHWGHLCQGHSVGRLHIRCHSLRHQFNNVLLGSRALQPTPFLFWMTDTSHLLVLCSLHARSISAQGAPLPPPSKHWGLSSSSSSCRKSSSTTYRVILQIAGFLLVARDTAALAILSHCRYQEGLVPCYFSPRLLVTFTSFLSSRKRSSYYGSSPNWRWAFAQVQESLQCAPVLILLVVTVSLLQLCLELYVGDVPLEFIGGGWEHVSHSLYHGPLDFFRDGMLLVQLYQDGSEVSWQLSHVVVVHLQLLHISHGCANFTLSLELWGTVQPSGTITCYLS